MREESDETPDPPDWVSPDYEPPTEPRGDEPPPPNEPPTAVGASEDPPPPRRFVEAWRRPGWRPEMSLARLTTQILDTLDSVGDRIAEGLGLR
ncbi:MAG TPA: hypothetical protein VJN70_21335 [Gemmatimonadaceae bacterium]|nr:hypothetical protein [Gemmatimonadaceae bacterium]